MSMSKVFDSVGIEPKPRTTNQIWAKDVGYDEAPCIHGPHRAWNFLDVAGERIDYVAILAGIEPPRGMDKTQD